MDRNARCPSSAPPAEGQPGRVATETVMDTEPALTFGDESDDQFYIAQSALYTPNPLCSFGNGLQYQAGDISAWQGGFGDQQQEFGLRQPEPVFEGPNSRNWQTGSVSAVPFVNVALAPVCSQPC